MFGTRPVAARLLAAGAPIISYPAAVAASALVQIGLLIVTVLVFIAVDSAASPALASQRGD